MSINLKKIVMLGVCWMAFEGMQNPVRAKLTCEQAMTECKKLSSITPYNSAKEACRENNYIKACNILMDNNFCKAEECEPYLSSP